MFRPDITGMKPANDDLSGLPVIRPKVAGIDLASEIHWVCAPKVDGSGREVEKFGATTPELARMAQWLKERGVESVAMESTGVYWIAPHEVLERHGFEMLLVNTRDLARVPGRKKTDRVDCIMCFQLLHRWIQRLHSCGLLTGSFRPTEQVCMLRTLVRDKKTNVLSNSCTVGGRASRLDAADAKKSGPNECAGAPGGIAHRRHHRYGDHARHRRRRSGRPAVGEITKLALLQERRGNCRGIEWALAGRPLIMRYQLLRRQLEAGLENVRHDPGADCRV